MPKIYKSQIQVLTLEEVGVDKWPGLSWSDAPAALIIEQPELGQSLEWNAVWGLPSKMTVEDAWADYDHADEYEIVD